MDLASFRALPPAVVKRFSGSSTTTARMPTIPVLGHRIGNDIPTLDTQQGRMDILGEFELSAQPGRGLEVQPGYLPSRERECVSKYLEVVLQNRIADPILQRSLRGMEGVVQGLSAAGNKP